MNEIALSKSQMSDNDIQTVVKMIDQESANAVYRRCAEEFNFKTVEIEGNVVSVAKELAPVFGYSGAKDVLRVLLRNGIETLVCSTRYDVSKVQAEFNLSMKDHATKLIDYRGFLTIAREGESAACDKVRQYLLAMEQKARVDSVVYETTGMNAEDLQDVAQYLDDPLIVSAIESQKRMKDIIQLRVQQLETQAWVKALETKLSVTSEQEHTLNQKRDELVSLQSMNGMDKRKAYARFYRIVKSRFHIGIWTGMEREKFPLAVEWIDSLIAQEQQKLKQLDLFHPASKVVAMRSAV